MRTVFSSRLRVILSLAGLLLVAALPVLAQDVPSGSALTGAWSAEEAYFRPVIRFERAGDGTLVAFLAGNAQEKGAPFSQTRARGDSLFLASARMGVQFQGVILSEEQVIEGTWVQGEQSARLTLTPVEAVTDDEVGSASVSRQQRPEKPYPYQTEEVTFHNEADEVTLAGTLTTPDAKGPHPGVVLLHGSGSNGRDYEFRGQKIFRVLADHLTRQGVAVLRYDMRGVGESGGSLGSARLEDLSEDAASALRYLKARSDTDASHVGLVAHSMGGMIAASIHNQFESTAFLALLAPPSVAGYEVLSKQSARFADAGGATAAEVDSIEQLSHRVFEILRSARDSAGAATQLKSLFEGRREQGDPLQLTVESNTSAWFRDFVRYDPRPDISQVDVPVLALFGEQDLGVPPHQNAGPMRTALAESPSKRTSVRVLDGLNHFLQPAERDSSATTAKSETIIAPEVLAQLTEWIWESSGIGESRPD